ncbi:Xaa-Pro dipeptidyl-peptidase [Lapidilactobacillus bayanensis]|uniref:Xaa-Pro dipeptidyl-peptidase n=1 Tax=Lapidilactobacillus bayanensis TaxID=2485998 RepID=UPI000F7B4D99|nr:Xaa-Pro dipeptidyl-peptidase [Lapidilactobacillus bayanensis]
MKYNQFAYSLPTPQQQILELQRIKIYPVDVAQYSFDKLTRHVFRHLFPDYRSQAALETQFSNLLVNKDQTLFSYLANIGDRFEQHAFYNVALQLLGFYTPLDFSLTDPIATMKKLGLPFVDKQYFNTESLTSAVYQLLNTRSKNGYALIDNLAARGYYAVNLSSGEQQRPLFFNGKAQATFSADNLIREVVYVESDLDTDNDGQRDLLEATIIRPQTANDFIKLPALYTANPYFKGTTDTSMNNVDLKMAAKPIGDARENQDQFDDFKTFATTNPATALTNPFANHPSVAEPSLIGTVTLSDYFLQRGFASVYAAGIGTRGSDGIGTCGSPEQTASTIAIIEWLHGDRRAFTDRSRLDEVAATWCSGHVSMTGKSYLGTLAIAAATTGVAGLDTVISEAAISSWYDYYREHGLVVAPQTFQGEDTDVLTNECFSRQKDAGDYAKVKPFYDQKLAQMKQDQDRETGSYNHFWDVRNYRNNINLVKCPIVSVHGLNDWNVKPKNVYKLNQVLKEQGIDHKVILHQGQHIYINNFPSLDFYDLINMWLSNKLCGIENHADAIFPDYLIQSNLDESDWQTPATWDGATEKDFALTKNFEITSENKDHFVDNGVQAFHESGLKDLAWEEAFIQQDKRFANNQIVFKTPELKEELLITGRPVVHLNVKSSANHGLISAMLIDYGEAKRLTVRPQTVELQTRQLGYHGPLETTMAFKTAAAATPAKLIAKGHLNLQNRLNAYESERVEPDQQYELDLRLQPTYYHLPAGHRLGIILYATDMGMTIRDQNEITYTFDLESSKLVVNLG